MSGTVSYVYFLFSNVFNTSNDILPMNPSKIKVGMILNFHIINIGVPSINEKKCYHAGLLWKVKKPNLTQVTIDPTSAASLLKLYLVYIPPTEAPKPNIAPVKVPTPPREKRLAAAAAAAAAADNANSEKKYLNGYCGSLWKAINANEGMMLLRREKRSLVIWFNKSNLKEVKKKFNSVQELYKVVFHFDAELLYSPAGPNDYVWYQGTAFWDEHTPRPVLPNILVGSHILQYKPTSEFSLLLKEGLELKRTNKFDSSKLDKVFRELTKTEIFTGPSQKNKAQPSTVNQVKEENVRRSSLPDSNSLTITPLWKISTSSSSLPNEFVKKESESDFPLLSPFLVAPKATETKKVETRKIEWIQIASGSTSTITLNSDDKITGIGDNSCFQTPNGHFLNIKETKLMPDYFSRALDFKAIFSCIRNKEDTISSRLPQEIEHWVTTSHKELIAKSEQTIKNHYSSCLPLDILNSKAFFPFEEPNSKYLLKLKGHTLHVSLELKMGLIYCQYGFVIFKFENFYDFDKNTNEWRKEKKIVNGLDVFFDAILEKGNNYHFIATCVWVEKRPDIHELITSVAKIPDKLKPGKYFGHVVKLDLPSNAIVKLEEEDVGVVVTRSIFDPNKTTNIAEYLAIGQEIAVIIEKSDDFFYAQNAFRYDRPEFELNPDKNVKGYGVITNYSHHAGIFQFRTRNKVHNGIFSKDLVKYFDDNGTAQYFPIGSCIYFKGYDMRLALCELSVIASEIKGSRVLKENEGMFGKEMERLEFVSKKVYAGTVKEIRRPYAFILECLDEKKAKVKVFVSSRKFAPNKGENNLTYSDQIQHYVKINDNVAFTPEICSSTDLHPFKWHAAQAWKVKKEEFFRTMRQSSSETEKSGMGDSFMTACSGEFK